MREARSWERSLKTESDYSIRNCFLFLCFAFCSLKFIKYFEFFSVSINVLRYQIDRALNLLVHIIFENKRI
jgi:hypothetical protein